MKYLVSLILATLVGVVCMGCQPNPANYSVPAGYERCNPNGYCHRGHCGFVGVDTYPVCRP